MFSLKSSFTAAASGDTGFSTFWLLVFAVAIIDDGQHRDKKRREKERDEQRHKKRETCAKLVKPPGGPRLF